MFELKEFTTAKLNSVNLRAEKHGPDNLVPAVDLSFTLDAPNTFLDQFDPQLMLVLYRAPVNDVDNAQGELDGVDAVSDRPILALPKLALPIRWTQELAGFRLVFERGLAGKSNLEFGGCEVNNFQFTPKQGGTVEVKFRVQCNSGLDEKVLGKVALLAQHEVSIQLLAPEEAQTDLEKKAAAGKSAEELFAGGGSTETAEA